MTLKITMLALTFLTGLIMIPIVVNAEIFNEILIYPDESSLAGAGNLLTNLNFDYTLIDSSGNNNTAILVTGTEQYVNGTFGDAFDFNGNSYLKLLNQINFTFSKTDPFSIATRMQYNESATVTTPFVMKASGNGVDPGWKMSDDSNGKILFIISDGAYSWVVPATTSIEGAGWKNVVLTYDGSGNRNGMKIYIDGRLDKQGTSDTTMGDITNSLDPTIGATSAGDIKAGSSYNVDYIRIYSKTLSIDEIWAIGNMTGFTDVAQKLADLEAENISLQNQISSVNSTVQNNTIQIDYLYTIWQDIKDSIVTWLAGRP